MGDNKVAYHLSELNHRARGGCEISWLNTGGCKDYKGPKADTHTNTRKNLVTVYPSGD